jgi:ubiquinone/menaquinone biosynthesis C-methylase UbiE
MTTKPEDQKTGTFNGILNYNKFQPAENSETIDRLNRLIETTKEKSFLEAIDEHAPDLTEYVSQKSRLMFLDLLPLSNEKSVLEIGPGLGQMTRDIASRSKNVTALEVVKEQAFLTKLRFKEEGIKNIDVFIGGDDNKLPFPDQSFDVLVMNLVIEWCAMRNTTDQKYQDQYIQECFRVLKPGGVLWISTKNRYALRYLAGKSDEHVYDYRFGNALPRFLMALQLALHGKKMPEGLLYSYCELSRSVKKSGFYKQNSFLAIPDMRYPDEYISYKDSKLKEKLVAQENFKQYPKLIRLMRFIPQSLIKYFAPNLSFLLIKK